MGKSPTRTFLIDAVAVYRLTKLVTEDKLTEDLRDFIYEKFPDRNSKMRYLITCPWCISIWAGMVIFTLRKYSPDTADWLSTVLAASAITGIAATKGY